MSSLSEARPNEQATAKASPAASRSPLQELLKKPIGQNQGKVFRELESPATIDRVEARLPDKLKGQGQRLLAVAKSYVKKQCANPKSKLSNATVESLIDCINEAAEFGFALDGKHCYAVVYGTQATFQPSYIGMIAVARRVGVIKDAWANVVMPSDSIRYEETDGVQHVRFAPDLKTPRSYQNMVGVLVCVQHQAGHRYDWLTKTEIDRLRERSPAKSSGPWVSDPEEMSKKAALRRVLKTFSDDPAMIALFDTDDRHVDLDSDDQASSWPKQDLRRMMLEDTDSRRSHGREDDSGEHPEPESHAVQQQQATDETPAEPTKSKRRSSKPKKSSESKPDHDSSQETEPEAVQIPQGLQAAVDTSIETILQQQDPTRVNMEVSRFSTSVGQNFASESTEVVEHAFSMVKRAADARVRALQQGSQSGQNTSLF